MTVHIIAYTAYRAWQDYGELTETALHDIAVQYGMPDGQWAAVRQEIQRIKAREA